MDVRIVTSFSPLHWDDYVQRILPRNMELWPADWQVWVDDHSRILPGDWNVHCLAEDPEHEAFMENWNRILLKNNDLATALVENRFPSNYTRDAGMFCHKVFAMTHPEMRWDCDWLVWLGADVEIREPVTPGYLSDILVGDVVHLGRKDMPASETEFLAFHIGKSSMSRGSRFLSALRHIYTSGDIYRHAEWTDAYVVARMCAVVEGLGWNVHNLSAGIPGLDVWPETVLAQTMSHYKGGKKAELIDVV